jgi:hypothetical protein
MRTACLARAFMLCLTLVMVTRPASATPVTLNFNGTTTAFNGSGFVNVPYQGSVTWDPATAVVVAFGSGYTDYSIVGATFSLNGVDQTSRIFAPQSIVQVADGLAGADQFSLDLSFSPGTSPFGFGLLFGALVGPTTMFSSTSLPMDLGFLSAVTTQAADFMCGAPGCMRPLSTTFAASAPSVPSVPEPGSLLLLGTGVVALARRRFARAR